MADEAEGVEGASGATGEAGAQGATGGGDAPWSADLAERFPDEAVRSQVDAYIREKIQPHTTQLEQSVSELREAVPEGLQEFWADLGEDPGAALQKIAAEVYSENPEAAQIFEVAVKYAAANPDATEEEAVAAASQHVEAGRTPDEFEIELDPEDRERLNFVDQLQAKEEDELYAADLTKVQTSNPELFPATWTTEQMREIMDPLVIASPEDLDDDAAMQWAVDRYTKTRALIHGGAPGSEAAAAEAAGSLSPEQVAAIEAGTGAPTVITGGQNASVPVQKQYASIGEAAREFGAELAARNAAPPVV